MNLAGDLFLLPTCRLAISLATWAWNVAGKAPGEDLSVGVDAPETELAAHMTAATSRSFALRLTTVSHTRINESSNFID